MNNVYKSVWNEALGAWVAVSETAKGRGKKSNKKIVSSVLLASASAAGGMAFAPAAFASQICGTNANGALTSSIQGGSTSLVPTVVPTPICLPDAILHNSRPELQWCMSTVRRVPSAFVRLLPGISSRSIPPDRSATLVPVRRTPTR
ncbi:ESPR domain-containing protein [Caballeronia sp. SEWSISQ10-4 2]|uniref:ESPR domain-containing protein n=1 Tax=Caballeronia sp. SEWSISQ10-4 2 TaxID=2937438 RepID=UPI003462AAEF